MNEPFGVREPQPLEDVAEDDQRVRFGQSPLRFYEVAQILAVHELHDQKELTGFFEKVGDLDDIRIIQERLLSCFVVKPITKIRIATQGFRETLDGKPLGKLEVFRQIDNPHPALANLRNNAKIP